MFERPSLDTLIERTRADVLTRLSTDDVLRLSNPEVLARAEAGAVHGLYGYLDYIANQILPDTATDTLERHGSLWGIPRKQASKAVGTVALTASAVATVAAGTVLQAADGTQYETLAEYSLESGVNDVTVRAVLAGKAGNISASSPLSLVSPISGVQSSATVILISGGADKEGDEDYRARILARIRKTPQGGAAHDYVSWALEIAGVTRAWCYPEELGPGTVTVRFVRDDDENPIPDATEVQVVADHIADLRPVTADVTVIAPVAVPITFQIQAASPSTSLVRSAIEASLRALIRAESEPGETLLISHIREAISMAAGEYDHVLVAPAANVNHSAGHMATFGGITWL